MAIFHHWHINHFDCYGVLWLFIVFRLLRACTSAWMEHYFLAVCNKSICCQISEAENRNCSAGFMFYVCAFTYHTNFLLDMAHTHTHTTLKYTSSWTYPLISTFTTSTRNNQIAKRSNYSWIFQTLLFYGEYASISGPILAYSTYVWVRLPSVPMRNKRKRQ